jgi:hypothetical protein
MKIVEVKLCRDCLKCKIYRQYVRCDEGKFTNLTEIDIIDYIPEDFDCDLWEGDDEIEIY